MLLLKACVIIVHCRSMSVYLEVC